MAKFMKSTPTLPFNQQKETLRHHDKLNNNDTAPDKKRFHFNKKEKVAHGL